VCTTFEVAKNSHTSIQGVSNVNAATQHSVSIYLRFKHTDWHTTLDCAVLINITGTTPPTRLDTSSWKISIDINLADTYVNQPGGIDLLIGADLFYEMLQPGRHTLLGNCPVIQETVLGWTIAGRTPANTTLDVKRAFLLETSKLDYFIKHFWEVESMEPSTITAKQKACEKHFYKHNPTEEGRVVDRHPTKLGSIQPGTSRLSAEQGPSITDHRLGRGPKMKV
jgi:hypothetical protein